MAKSIAAQTSVSGVAVAVLRWIVVKANDIENFAHELRGGAEARGQGRQRNSRISVEADMLDDALPNGNCSVRAAHDKAPLLMDGPRSALAIGQLKSQSVGKHISTLLRIAAAVAEYHSCDAA